MPIPIVPRATKAQSRSVTAAPSMAGGLPEPLEAYLAEQQTRAYQLHDVLKALDQSDDPPAGAIAAAVRMARELNNALDSITLSRVLEGRSEEPVQ